MDNIGPFAGIRVLDLTSALQSIASMMLGDLGADVIKVEQPDGSHRNRKLNIAASSGALPESIIFLSVDRNKRSVTLDFTKPEGRRVFLELVRTADVITENFGAGKAERWGIGYEALREVNPRLIYCAVTAYGRKGPYSKKKAIDLNVQGYAGHMDITGQPGGPPTKCAPPVGDFPAVYLSVYGIAAALFARERTGVGQRVDMSLLDGAMMAMMPREQEFWLAGRSTQRLGTRHPSVAPHQAFECGDGRLITLEAGKDHHFQALCDIVGLPEFKADARFRTVHDRYANREVLLSALEKAFLKRAAREWIQLLDKADVMCGLVQTVSEAFSDPQLIENEMVVEIQHPQVGKMKVLGVPVKLSETPGSVRLPSPLLGQHTNEVLLKAGIGQRQLDALREHKII